MQRFQTIAISGKPGDAAVAETVRRIVEHLVERDRTVLVDSAIASESDMADITVAPREELASRCDLLISVGGDGTLLSVARSLVDYDVPILGVNLGRLGFLVDVSPGNLSELDLILAGEFIADERFLLEATVRHDDEILERQVALNDVVLQKWNTARMIEFSIHVNGELISHNRSDGLIVSTPTGSTAYAMAGGGPILHPHTDAMVLVPICPHTLSSRPLVINAESEVEVNVAADALGRCSISCDGQRDFVVAPGARLFIRRYPRRVRILHPPQYRYFELLRAKLRWGDTYVR